MRTLNFSGVELSETLKEELCAFEKTNRMPHAIIISGSDAETRKNFCKFLSMWAVCTSEDNAPCGGCPQCHKVKTGNHIDIYYAKGSGKTDAVSVSEIRNIGRDTAIIPNEAKRKIYVIYDADKRMGAEALNAFLKTLEEPMQDIMFLMTAEVPSGLPETILSRCTVLSLDKRTGVDADTLRLAESVLDGMVEMSEMSLLRTASVFSSKKATLETLPIVRELLSDALSMSVGAEAVHKSESSRLISQRLTRKKIIELINATSDAINKTNRNVNNVLLSTWLCGEYRRITWQK